MQYSLLGKMILHQASSFSPISPQFINKHNCQFINKSCAVLPPKFPPNAQNEKQFASAVKNICAMINRKTGLKTKDIKLLSYKQ